MSDTSTFDRLVSALSSEERQDLLQRIEQSVDIREAPPLNRGDEAPVDLDQEFQSFSIWRRIWVWLRSLVAGVDRYELMRTDALKRLLSAAEREAPELVDAREAVVTAAFVREIELVKKSAQYFSSALSHALGQRKAEFYALLAGLEVPELRDELLRATDPFHLASRNPEMNYHQLKQLAQQHLDEATMVVPGTASERMEQHARLLSVLYALCNFDWGSVGAGALSGAGAGALSADGARPGGEDAGIGGDLDTGGLGESAGASSTGAGDSGGPGSGPAGGGPAGRGPTGVGPAGSGQSLQIAALAPGISELAGMLRSLTLCQVGPRPLEALWLFTQEDTVTDPGDEAQPLEAAVNRGKRHVEALFDCATRLPLEKLARYGNGDLNYRVEPTIGPDAWRELVKRFWTGRIDSLISLFRVESDIRGSIDALSGSLGAAPQVFPGYPESAPIGHGIHALSLGVIDTLASSLFPRLYQRPLYRLLIDGEFYKEENREEFNRAYEWLTGLAEQLQAFRDKLGPEGSVQKQLEEVYRLNSHRERMERWTAVTRPVHQEARTLVDHTLTALRSLSHVLYGILYGEVGGRYDTLSNLGQIGGREHDTLMRQFDAVLSSSNALLENLSKLLDSEDKLREKLR